MPDRIAGSCRVQGCARPAYRGFCEDHRPERHREYGEERRRAPGPFDAFYRSAEWRKLRDGYAARHPLCVHCLARGITRGMRVVDHKHELEDGGAPLDPGNLQSLCFPCDRTKTAAARAAREGRGGRMSGVEGQSSGRPTLRASSGNSEGGDFGGSEGPV